MKHVFYENAAFELFVDDGDFFVHQFIEPMHLYLISYKDFIEEISYVRDKSEAWKRLTIIEAGRLAGILEEVA